MSFKKEKGERKHLIKDGVKDISHFSFPLPFGITPHYTWGLSSTYKGNGLPVGKYVEVKPFFCIPTSRHLFTRRLKN